MKLFLDTANLDELKRALAWGIIDGVTTNPTLIAREGRPIEERILAICEMVEGDVSAAVVATAADEMVCEGRTLAALHRNVVVKLPVTSDGIAACSRLSREGIRCNVTLVFSVAQALLAAKAGAYLVSPFIGRIDDLGQSGVAMVGQIVTMYRTHGISTQVLAASVRTPDHAVGAALAGADVATMTYTTMEAMFQHPLTDKGQAQFLKDWARVFQDDGVTR